jgi:hypothetical protein
MMTKHASTLLWGEGPRIDIAPVHLSQGIASVLLPEPIARHAGKKVRPQRYTWQMEENDQRHAIIFDGVLPPGGAPFESSVHAVSAPWSVESPWHTPYTPTHAYELDALWHVPRRAPSPIMIQRLVLCMPHGQALLLSFDVRTCTPRYALVTIDTSDTCTLQLLDIRA